MLILATIVVILIFAFLKNVIHELEKQEALLVNATLSSNESMFLGYELDDAWRTVRVLENVTAAENLTVNQVKVEPDWSLVQGTFTHLKDENFESFLIAVGVPYLVRSFIVKTTPTVTIERLYQDSDYYYELEDHNPNTDLDQVGGEDGGRVYQILINTITWLKTNTERFRLGYSFMKKDFDGSPSKNTYYFVSPSVLVHLKEKEQFNTNIIRSFDREGFVMTIINKKAGMKAKRYFLREPEEA
ncbi:uncharacterized protein LOC121876085 [Homarus americanus]|uniref:uncharacterized protein LOC121876085 n=1 Tax=Homarus americanus TaxID=6706 RepID=UPI001C46B27F|nr:uncharacterized protein LOC121876085 [Homarus americanus]